MSLDAELAPLPRTDGSATFSFHGYKIIGAVHGPLEAHGARRDEAAFEAYVDVLVRPASGVGATRERHLEDLLQSTLRQLIPVKDFPRSLFQIVLQVTETPENAYVHEKTVQSQVNISILPPLLHTSILSLLDAAVPLKCIATATLVSVQSNDLDESNQSTAATRKSSSPHSHLLVDPSPQALAKATSAHVLAFTSNHDELLLVESEGSFTVEEWDQVVSEARRICCQPRRSESAMDEDDDSVPSTDLREFIRRTMEAKIKAERQWKHQS